ncbi:MAG: DTW domain-containing protein, partial [Bradyrhizobium sp.]|nr:DTW domain-containing protein [Bradyrhizobium sp.]
MSDQPHDHPPLAEAPPDCPHCQKPLPLCICDSVTPLESRLGLLILQHPQEQ